MVLNKMLITAGQCRLNSAVGTRVKQRTGALFTSQQLTASHSVHMLAWGPDARGASGQLSSVCPCSKTAPNNIVSYLPRDGVGLLKGLVSPPSF